MTNIYTNGKYLEASPTWHVEDSCWKADHIGKLIERNRLKPRTVAEIGCGAGGILHELSAREYLRDVEFSGYDISPQAISLAHDRPSGTIRFYNEDPLANSGRLYFDILLVIDVFEHVPDYIGFVGRCRTLGQFKIFHIPLDIHVSSVLRNAFMEGRYSVGHLHYFTADSAIALLRDTGYEILDSCYTDSAFGMFRVHPSTRKALANVPRWLVSLFSVGLSARLFGGFSLLVLAK